MNKKIDLIISLITLIGWVSYTQYPNLISLCIGMMGLGWWIGSLIQELKNKN
jgi:hypothetical protein